MINHARTLLLNKPGRLFQPGTLGEEYIPAAYSTITLPSYLQAPHDIIFGTNPDKVFENYRLAELLNVIHSTEFAEFIYRLDPRVTYTQTGATPFFGGQISGVLEKVGGLDRARLAINGSMDANTHTITGRALFEYFVRITAGDEQDRVTITEIAQNAVYEEDIQWVSGSNNGGTSLPIKLPGTALTVQFSGIVASDTPALYQEIIPNYLLLEDGDKIALTTSDVLDSPQSIASGLLGQWRLQLYVQPLPAISTILPRLDLLGEPLFLELFGLQPHEPLVTFRHIWADHDLPVYRLCAFVLAMIYQTEQLRIQQ